MISGKGDWGSITALKTPKISSFSTQGWLDQIHISLRQTPESQIMGKQMNNCTYILGIFTIILPDLRHFGEKNQLPFYLFTKRNHSHEVWKYGRINIFSHARLLVLYDE